jgi:hypothetical protein
MQKIAAGIAALVLATGMSACGGGGGGAADKPSRPSESEWRAHVEEKAGRQLPEASWQRLKDIYWGADGWCSQKADDLALTIAVGVDSGQSVADQEEDLKFACPDRAKVIDAAIKQVQDNHAKSERICNSDPELLNADDRDYYDAVCVP